MYCCGQGWVGFLVRDVFQLHIANWRFSVMCNVRYHMFIYYRHLFIQVFFISFYFLFCFGGFGRDSVLSVYTFRGWGQALLAGSQPGRVVSLEGRLWALQSQWPFRWKCLFSYESQLGQHVAGSWNSGIVCPFRGKGHWDVKPNFLFLYIYIFLIINNENWNSGVVLRERNRLGTIWLFCCTKLITVAWEGPSIAGDSR